MNKTQELTTSLSHLQALKEQLRGVPKVHHLLHQVPCLINEKGRNQKLSVLKQTSIHLQSIATAAYLSAHKKGTIQASYKH
jgi:hypothetical protein